MDKFLMTVLTAGAMTLLARAGTTIDPGTDSLMGPTSAG